MTDTDRALSLIREHTRLHELNAAIEDLELQRRNLHAEALRLSIEASQLHNYLRIVRSTYREKWGKALCPVCGRVLPAGTAPCTHGEVTP